MDGGRESGVSEDLENRVANLEARLTGAEARAAERHSREVRMEEKLDQLLEESHQRRGREAAQHKQSQDQHDDRWQVWIRAFFPVAIITAMIQAIIAWFDLGGPTR